MTYDDAQAIRDEPEFPRCARCGAPVAGYASVWVERNDGSLRRASVLTLADYAGDPALRVWHVGCLFPHATA